MNTDNLSSLQEADKDEQIKALKEALAEKSEEIKRLQTRNYNTSTIAMLEKQVAQLKKKVIEWHWIDADKELPEKNVGVLVFIPEEDNHITAGMYDVSEKWVLLDEYREPTVPVTHWMKFPPEPQTPHT